MPSWIPGYRLLEGPEQTGIPFRYRAVRETDGVAAWIRVDGFDASSSRAAMAVDAIYTATAHFDHPLLPLVLDYGSTEVAGRSFIAYQISEPVAGGGHRTRRGMMTPLAGVQDPRAGCRRRASHTARHDDGPRRAADRGSRVRLRRHSPPSARAEASARGGASRGAASARERVPLRAAPRRRRERSRRTRGRGRGGAFHSPGNPLRVAGRFAPRGARLPAGGADPRASRGPRRWRLAVRGGRQDRCPVGPPVPASTVRRDRRAEGAGPARPVAAP